MPLCVTEQSAQYPLDDFTPRDLRSGPMQEVCVLCSEVESKGAEVTSDLHAGDQSMCPIKDDDLSL